MPVVVGADADAQLVDRPVRQEAFDLTTPPVGLRLAARYLRLRHLLPRYHTPVCHYIHACFRGEVKAGMSGFCGV
jgi:hypothetical protein